MCSADIFLGLLAILFPPLPGTRTFYDRPALRIAIWEPVD